MNRIFPLFLFLFSACSFSLFAQRTANIAYSAGVVNYIGDLGNEKDFPFSSANMGSAITIRDVLNNPKRTGTRHPVFDLQLRFSWHRLQYDETKPVGGQEGLQLRNYRRGLGFRNDLFGAETDFIYNIYPNLYLPMHKQKINFFLLAGVGMFYGQPKADLYNGSIANGNRYYFWNDGTIRTAPEFSRSNGEIISKDGVYETNLSDWHTEGQGINPERTRSKMYSNFNIGFPLGGGIRYFYNKQLTFSAELNYYFFLTDYLDDVSDRYATYNELQSTFQDPASLEHAKYISDPTGQGTNGNIETASRRGNPNIKDSFTYLSLEVAYKVTWKKKGVYGR